MAREVYYSDYLQLDKILGAQQPESDSAGIEAHDEMLFIVIHQAYELWFKQVIYELSSINHLLAQPRINDNAPDLQVAVHRAERITTILEVLVKQIDIMETMTPLDFLDFRDLLRPASGFQSVQFKELEAMLGLKFDQRHGQNYYLSHLRPEDVKRVGDVEKQLSLVELMNIWLERMPFFDEDSQWEGWPVSDSGNALHPFWKEYRTVYEGSLADIEHQNIAWFDEVLLHGDAGPERKLSARACRAGLFIMLYRNYPLLHMPFRMLNLLLEVDELMATWRYRHINMVHRIIGKRVGTGKSSGKDYLRSSLDKHYVFSEVAALTTFLVERRKLPQLPKKLEMRLGFINA